MNITKRPVSLIFAALVFSYANVASAYAQSDEELDARIRAVSESLIREVLQEKNDKILTLETKIKTLEQQLAALKQEQRQEQVQGQSQQKIDTNDSIATANTSDIAPTFTAPTAVITPPENELGLAGFYDFAALSKNVNQRHFEFGGLELGLEYIYSDHLAANAALVWDGDTADVGVAVIDYYWFVLRSDDF